MKKKKASHEVNAPESGLINSNLLYFLGAVAITAVYTCLHGHALWEAVASVITFVTFEVTISPKLHPSKFVRTMLSTAFASWIFFAVHLTALALVAPRR